MLVQTNFPFSDLTPIEPPKKNSTLILSVVIGCFLLMGGIYYYQERANETFS